MTATDQYRFFTMWTFTLFILTMILIPFNILPNWVIRGVLVSQIVVGIFGNILTVMGIEYIVKDLRETNPHANDGELISIGQDAASFNIYFHTLPMVLAMYLIPLFPAREHGDFARSLTFIFTFFLIWLLTPYHGAIMIDKINRVYLNPPLIGIAVMPILWMCFLSC